MAEVIRLVDIVKSYIMGDSVVHALDHVNVQIGGRRVYLYHGAERQREINNDEYSRLP